MDPEFEYAYHWLRDTAVRLYRPFDLSFNRRRVEEIEAGRPGFAGQLRLAALNAIQSGDRELVHKGIAALAIVGEHPDCRALEAVPPEHARTARTAIFEIEHNSHAG